MCHKLVDDGHVPELAHVAHRSDPWTKFTISGVGAVQSGAFSR